MQLRDDNNDGLQDCRYSWGNAKWAKGPCRPSCTFACFVVAWRSGGNKQAGKAGRRGISSGRLFLSTFAKRLEPLHRSLPFSLTGGPSSLLHTPNLHCFYSVLLPYDIQPFSLDLRYITLCTYIFSMLPKPTHSVLDDALRYGDVLTSL